MIEKFDLLEYLIQYFSLILRKIFFHFLFLSLRLYFTSDQRNFFISVISGFSSFKWYIFGLFSSHIFILKLSVCGNELRSTELGCNSLILSISRKLSLILRFLINYIEKNTFGEKCFFLYFSRGMEGRYVRQFCRVDQTLL